MVAVVSGNGLGLFNTSLTQLGTTFGGQTGIGQSRESQMVNIATGNLLLQDQDESLQVRGLNTTFLRTYNSRAQVSDAGQDGWITGFERHVALASGTFNTTGSTMALYTGDGQSVVFTWSSSNHYVTSAGDGANDTLVWSGASSTWTFTEGSTQRKETYANHADAILKGRMTQVQDGTSLAIFNVLYDSNNRVSEVRSVDDLNNATSDAILFGYNGTTTQLTSVTTREGGVVKSQLTYGYDGVGRLSWVQTDLTPTDATDDTWDGTTAANNDSKLFRTTYTYVTGTASDLRIASVATSDGVNVSYTYASDGAGGYQVASVTQGSASDGSAQTVTFTYNTNATDVTDASGRTWTYQYDANKRLTAVLEPAVSGLRTTTNYTYDAGSHVTQIQTVRGGTVLSETDNAYDSNENLTSQWTRVNGSSASAAVVQRTYSTANQVLTETRYTVLDTDGTGTGVVLSSGGLTTTYIYDTTNPDQLLFAVDAAGGVTQYTYGTSGNGIGQVASVRHFPAAAYAGAKTKTGLTTWTTTNIASSTLASYAYDVKGRLQQIVQYASVDSSGNGVLDVATSITSYTYSAQGLLLQKIDVHGASRTVGGTAPTTSASTDYIYDGLGRLLSVLKRDIGTATTDDANTIATTYAYTDSANQIKVTLDTGAIRTEARNAAGQLVSVSEVGTVSGTQVTRTTQNFYDAAGLLRATQDATGARTYLFYDGLGRLGAQVDATGAVTAFVYDDLNHLIQTVGYATRVDTSAWLSGSTVTKDTLIFAATLPTLTGNQAWVPTDAVNDRNTYQTFDAMGRLATQTDAAGLVTTYAYDGASHLLSVTVAKPGDGTVTPRVTTYYYDSADRPVGVVDAAGYLTESVYDVGGRLIKTIRYATLATAGTTLAAQRPAVNANDVMTRSFYNGRDQLVGQLAYAGGTTSAGTGYLTTYVYDEQANQRAVQAYGTLLTGLTGSETLATLQTSATGGSGGMQLTQRSFNGLGQLTTQLNPEGTVTRYTYDEAGRLVRTEADQGQSDVRENFDRYDVFGNLIGQISGQQVNQANATLAGKLLNDPSLTSAQLDAAYSAFGTTINYDLAGRRIESIDAQGNKTWYFYDADGRQTFLVRGVTDGNGIQNALGEVTETRYSAFGQVINQLAYTGRITVTTPGSRASVLTAIGTLSFVTATDTQRQRVYDVRGLLTGFTDAENVVSNFTYTAFGQLLQEQRAVGTAAAVTIQHAYDQRGLETSRIDAYGTSIARTVSQTYDAFGRAITQTDARGTVTTLVYDRLGRQLSHSASVDGTAQTWQATYDAYDRTLTQVDALGNATTYAYSDVNRSVTVTTAEGVVMSTVHNAFGQTVQVTTAAGTTSYAYDNNGALTQTTDALNDISSNTYDVRGLLTEATDASGRTVDYVYDALGRVLKRIADPTGLALTSTLSYDGQGRSIQAIDASGRITTTSYDREGRVLSVAQDPAGLNLVTSYTWDGAGRELTVTQGVGSSTPRTTAYIYDALGRRTSETVDPGTGHLNLTTSYAFDANDNVIARTDPLAHVSYFSYNEANQLRFTVDPAGDVSETRFDADGRIVMVRSYAKAATGISSAQSVAQMNSLITTQVLTNDAADPVQYRIYNRDSRLRFTVDGLGDVNETRYDTAGRAAQQLGYVTALTLSGADLTALKAGTMTAATIAGRVAAQEALAHGSYVIYDAAGRVHYTVSHSQVGASVVGTVAENRYDAAGRIIAQVQYAPTVTFDPTQTDASLTSLLTAAQGNLAANQHITRVVFDAAGRQRFTVSDAGTVSEQRFDAAGRVVMTRQYGTTVPVQDYTETTLAAAVAGFTDTRQLSYAYDGAGRLTSTTDALGQIESYGYDALGNRTSLTNKLGFVWTYVFDAAGRQTEIHTPLVTVLRFDSSGNLLAPSSESVVTKMAYDALGNVTSRTEAYGTAEARTTTYTYDARGNQIDTLFPDAWTVNTSGVLVASGLTPNIHITYNALDQAVVQKDVRGNYSYKVYDLQGRLAYDIDANGYVTGYGYDAQGEVVQLTRYATKLNTAGITGWSAGTAITLGQMQTAGVLVTGSGDRTINTTFDVAGNKRIVTQTAVTYTKSDGTTATGSPRTEFELNAYGQVVKESVLLEGTAGQSDAKWATTFHYYDDLGRKAMDVDAEGYVTTWSYTAQGEVSQQTQYARALSATVFNALTTAAKPSLPAAGDATIGYDRITRYTYDALGRKASETAVAMHYAHADGTSGVRDVLTLIGYDAVDEVIATTVDGVATQTTFDALGRTVAVEEAQRSILASTFDTQLSGAASATTNLTTAALYVQSSPYTTMAYDAFGNAVQVRRYANGWVQGQGSAVTSTSDQVQTTQYDRQGRAAIARDPEGNAVYRHYDAADNLIEVDERLDGNDGRWANVRSLATYDASNQQTLTQVFRDTYLNATALGTVTDQVVQVKYNAFGEITSKGDDPNPNATLAAQYGYDAVGRMITCNAQGGVLRTYGYNLAGFQGTESHTVTVATGDVTATTTQATDRLGRVTQVTLPSYTDSLAVTSTVSQTLDRWGNVIQLVDPRGYVTNTAYNQRDQKVAELQPLVKVVDATGTASWVRPQTLWFYGAQGRLEGTQDADGHINTIVYDASGRQIQTIDAFGNATLQAFDAFGQQRLTQDAMGYITFQSVDRNGRVTGQGDYLPSGAARTKATLQAYTLDQNGDRIAVTDAMAQVTKDDFDSRSLLLRSQSATGVVMNYAFDASGHKTLQEDGDSSHIGVESWTTDFFGRTTAHTDLSGRTYGYSYDASSAELVTETTSDGLNRSTIYYANGQVRQTTETGGPTCYYEYDAAGNRTLEETTSTDTQGTSLHVRTRTYYDSHNRIMRVVQDDVVTGVRVFDLSYAYDAQGNRTQVVATSGYGTNTTAISAADTAPVVVAAPANLTLRSGIAASFTIRASDVFRDPELDTLTIGVTQLVGGVSQALPSWLTVTQDATGQLVFSATSGSTAALGQTLTIQLAATDTSANTTITTFTIGVVTDSAPVSSGLGTTAFVAKTDQAWALEVPASTYFSDKDVGDTLTLSVTGVSPTAPWLTVDVSNPSVVRLSGTPALANAGTYTISVTATDASGASVTRTLTVVVTANHAPIATTIAPQNATLNRTFDLTRNLAQVFTDPEGDALSVTATLADGTALPSWLNFSYLSDQAVPQLRLSGDVPSSETIARVYQVKLTATDTSGVSTSTIVAITIQPNRPPLVVGSAPSLSGSTNTAFAADIPIASVFSSPDGDTLAFDLMNTGYTGASSWIGLSVNYDNGLLHLSGTPAYNQAGDYTVQIRAHDADGLSVLLNVNLHITNSPTLAITALPPSPTLYVGQAFSLTIPPEPGALSYSANQLVREWDAESGRWIYTPDVLPTWLVFDPASRTFSGTVPSGAAAQTQIEVDISDGTNFLSYNNFFFNVSGATRPANNAPTGATLPNQHAIPNQPWSYTFAPDTFSDADYDPLTYSATGLPTGVTFNGATRTFSGTPTTTGTSTINLTASDGRGGTVTKTFTLSVAANSAPTVVTAIPNQTLASGAWSYTVPAGTFTDANGDALIITATSIPQGVVFSGGVFSGTPAVGRYSINVVATDPFGASVSSTFVLTVGTPANLPPVVAVPLAAQTAVINQAWSYAFPAGTFVDPDGNTLTYTATGLPPGLTFTSSTRTISGTPTSTGSWGVIVTASDGNGGSVSSIFNLTVATTANHAPVVASGIANQTANQSSTWSFAIPAGAFSDADNDALSYAATGMPTGISYNPVTGTFSGTPTAQGVSTITVTASDGRGGSISTSFTLTVSAPVEHAPTLAIALANTTVPLNTMMAYQIPTGTFVDPDGDPLTYTATLAGGGALPAWLNFNAAQGTFSGIPTVATSLVIQVTANDGRGGSVSTTFQMTATATSLRQQSAYYSYDAMNRVSVTNGALVNGQVVVSANAPGSSAAIYDAAGHLIGNQSWGYDAIARQSGVVVNESIMNLRGQATAILAPHLLSDGTTAVTSSQTYDADGRLLETRNYFAEGTFYSYPDGEGEPEAVDVSGMLESAQQYTYDADGRMLSQTELARPTGTTTRMTVSGQTQTFPTWILDVPSRGTSGNGQDQYNDLGVLSTSSIVSYVGTNLGYDAAGRLKGYTYYSAATASTETFLETYAGRDTWLEAAVTGSSTNTNDRPTTSTIAYDKYGRETSITEHTVYGSLDDRLRVFVADGAGQILRRRDGTLHSGVFTQSTDTPTLQMSNHHMVYADGQQVAALDEYGTIDALSHVTGFANTNIGSSDVVVQDGETLQSIAQRIYGDSSLWYVLAAANALDANTALVAGSTLKAPQVTTNSNNASTFKPYNPADITGPTAPALPHIPPPPSSGCGTLGLIIMIAVTILVTVYTAGVGTAGISATSSLGDIMGAGVNTLAGGSIEAAAIGGAVGSVAGQITGDALGVTHGFSIKSVLTSAITAGLGAYVGGVLRGVTAFTDGAPVVHGLQSLNMAGKLVDALANYGTSVVANVVTGQNAHFSWAAVGATAVGSILSSELGGSSQILKGGTAFDGFVNNLTSYAIDGAVNAGARQLFGLGKPNWKQVATDAFGNALAGSIIGAAIADGDPKAHQQSNNSAPTNLLADNEASGSGSAQTASTDGSLSPLGFASVAAANNSKDAKNLDRIEVKGTPDPAIVSTRDLLSMVLQMTGLTHAVDVAADAYHHFTHYVSGLNAQAQANVARMQIGFQQAESFGQHNFPFEMQMAKVVGNTTLQFIADSHPAAPEPPGLLAGTWSDLKAARSTGLSAIKTTTNYTVGAVELTYTSLEHLTVKAVGGLISPFYLSDSNDAANAVQQDIKDTLDYTPRSQGARDIGSLLAPVGRWFDTNIARPVGSYSESHLGIGMTVILGGSIEAAGDIATIVPGAGVGRSVVVHATEDAVVTTAVDSEAAIKVADVANTELTSAPNVSEAARPVNSKGVAYPQAEIPGYGEVPFPDGPYSPSNVDLRSSFTDAYKSQFKNWWSEQGYQWPEGPIQIHHIQPLSKAGTNAFENLVPLSPAQHLPFTTWWRSYP